MTDHEWVVGLMGFLIGFNVAMWWVVLDRWLLEKKYGLLKKHGR